MYEQIISDLRKSYDRKVEERDNQEVTSWKVHERKVFLSLLYQEGCRKLLEIGAGTGIHGKFFHDHGMQVICIDLSIEMAKRCRTKGLEAYVMEFLHLAFPSNSFDAVFAMNCLLHVPKENLPRGLAEIRRLLFRNGYFYWGQYGGQDQSGIYERDHYEPKRYFSFLTDSQLIEMAQETFEVISFKSIELEEQENLHFQSLMLRRVG